MSKGKINSNFFLQLNINRNIIKNAIHSQFGGIMYSTNHKKTIINIFECNKNEALSANSVLELVDGSINRATVYRQINNLLEEGVLRKTYNPMTKSYEYQFSDDCSNHFHLACSKCGKIIHLKCSEVEKFVSHIVKEHGFKIDYSVTQISGICKECA